MMARELVLDYMATERWARYAPSTRRGYERILLEIVRWNPNVRTLKRSEVRTFLDESPEGSRTQHYRAAVLSQLVEYAVDREVRRDNPAKGLKLTSTKRTRAVFIWPEQDLQMMIHAADAKGWPGIGTALLVAHDQGFRPTDTLNLSHGVQYQGDRFKFKCSKTRQWCASPATARVALRIVQHDLRPIPDVEFQRRFLILRRKRKELVFAQLRHTHVVKALRAGLTPAEIACRTGHSLASIDVMIAEHYGTHDTEIAENGARKFEAYLEREKAFA